MIQQINSSIFYLILTIIVMMARNKIIFNLVALNKYKMAVNIAITAWNLALIDNLPTGKSLKTQLIKMFSSFLKLDQKQPKALFGELFMESKPLQLTTITVVFQQA